MADNKYCYEYPKAADITADTVVLSQTHQGWEVLLIKRRDEPYKGFWALPGGFLNEGEDPVVAAQRELKEETNLDIPWQILIQIGAYGKPGRDPRGPVLSIAYRVLTVKDLHTPTAKDDAIDIGWFPVKAPPPLAFDHAIILQDAVREPRSFLLSSQ